MKKEKVEFWGCVLLMLAVYASYFFVFYWLGVAQERGILQTTVAIFMLFEASAFCAAVYVQPDPRWQRITMILAKGIPTLVFAIWLIV